MNKTDLAYKAIFNNSPDAIFIVEFSDGKIGKFIDANRAACRSLGYSKKELLQLKPDKISFNVSSNKAPSFSREAFEELVSKKVFVFETVHVKKNGSKFPVRISAVIVKRDGQPVIAATARDISKFKQNEEKLKKAEQTYKDILEKTFDGIYKTKLRKPVSINSSIEKQVKAIFNNSVIIECNKAYAEMYGYKSAGKIIGKSLKSLYGGKLNTANYKSLVNFIKNGYSLQKTITEEKDIKGNVKFFSNNAVGIIENGMLVGTWGTQSDITESIQKTNELKLREEKFRTIFEQSPLGLLHFNEKGEIIEVNERFVELMGSTREKLIGFNSLKHAGDKKMRTAVKDMLTKGSAFYQGNYVSTTGKKLTPVKTWFKAIRDDANNIIGGTAITEDISAQIKVEKKLQISEEKYRTIFNSISEGIFLFDLAKVKITNVNQKVLDMYGYNFNEFVKLRLSDVSENTEPYTEKEALARLQKVSTKPQVFEWHARRKDNSLFWVEVNMRLQNVAGRQSGIVILRDITKQKEAEEELKISAKRFRNLVHSITEPIVIHSMGKFVFVNDAAVKLAGYKKHSDLIGQNVLDFVHPDYRGFALKRMLNSGNILPVVEEKFVRKDGTCIDVEVSGTKLMFKGKSAVQLTIRDITERKRNEKIQKSLFNISQAAVNASNLNQLFKQIHDIIKELMPADNFYIALYNKKENTLSFPYFVDEYDDFDKIAKGNVDVGKGFTAYVLKSKKSLIIDRKMEERLIKSGELEQIGSLTKIWIGILLKYKREIIGVLAVQDYHNPNAYGENEKQILTFVSEQIAQAIVKVRDEEMKMKYLKDLEIAKNKIEHSAKQLLEVNNELKISEEKLKEVNANKDKFFSILSHDLRSPFTALLGYAQLLEEAFDTLSEEEKKLSISSLHKTARNIFELLTGLLEWSRTQTGRMEFEPEKLELHKIAAETISILEMNAATKKIKLLNRLNKRSYAVADRNMVRTIIRNLLSNAIKFTKGNGKIEITGKTVKNFMQITVSDTGIGMRKDDIDRLFKIEEHHTTLGTNHKVGTGVGLILCKELVEKNGGKIWVESKIGEGSKFIFTLRKN